MLQHIEVGHPTAQAQAITCVTCQSHWFIRLFQNISLCSHFVNRLESRRYRQYRFATYFNLT